MANKDDLKIDILDIFGEDWAAPAVAPAPPPPPVAAPEPPSAPVAAAPEPPAPAPPAPEPEIAAMPVPEPVQETAPVAEPVPETAAAEAPAAEAAPPPFVPDEFLTGYDGFRTIILDELQGLVGDKKSLLMLGRTFELAREKFPQIFRNANWDESGNLREDGSLDQQRILANKATVDPAQAEITLDSALITLLNIRLQAIEKGLGVEVRTRVRSRMKKWITDQVHTAETEMRDAVALRRLNHFLL